MSEELETYEQAREKKFIEEISKISNDLHSIEIKDRVTLSERIFANVFLPFFAGDEKLLYDVNLATWSNYAGSPYKEVDVLDIYGNLLFTVPPMLDRTAVNPISNSNVSVSHVVATASQYARIHPSQGMQYMTSELNKRAQIMRIPANVIDNLKTWNKIFARYGRPPLMVIEETDDNNNKPLEYEWE